MDELRLTASQVTGAGALITTYQRAGGVDVGMMTPEQV